MASLMCVLSLVEVTRCPRRTQQGGNLSAKVAAATAAAAAEGTKGFAVLPGRESQERNLCCGVSRIAPRELCSKRARCCVRATSCNLLQQGCLVTFKNVDGFSATSATKTSPCVWVSSVLNREVKQFGKKYMFDGNEETCWNSDQGAIQWLMLEFPQTVKISQIQIQFQGGFGSRKCTLQGSKKGEELSQIAEFYPEDTNSLQSFLLQEAILDKLKINFENSTDFFGRIIIYRFDVLGEKL